MHTINIISFLMLFSVSAIAKVDFNKIFADREACFLIADLETGKIIAEHNPKRCKERFSPCSSFILTHLSMASYQRAVM